MPKSPKVSFGRTRAPQGNNELVNPPDPIQMSEWEDFLGTYPVNQRDSFGQGGPVSHRNRRSRTVSGPRNGRTNELDYDGT